RGGARRRFAAPAELTGESLTGESGRDAGRAGPGTVRGSLRASPSKPPRGSDAPDLCEVRPSDDAADIGAELQQLLLDALVAAIDLVDPVDRRRAARGKPCEDERR